MKYKFMGWASLLVLLFIVAEIYGWLYGPRYDERAWHFKAILAVVAVLLLGTVAFLLALSVYFFTL